MLREDEHAVPTCLDDQARRIDSQSYQSEIPILVLGAPLIVWRESRVHGNTERRFAHATIPFSFGTSARSGESFSPRTDA